MKKIVSIVAALAMATAMFAADPVININVAEFKGSASVTWGIDLDRGTTGFKNDANATLKIHFMDEGTKATSSDATVWGEISIKAGAIDNSASGTATVETAKLHVGPAWIGIKEGHTTVGDYKPTLATSSESLTTGTVGADATQGIEIGYKMDKMFSATVNFRSLPGAPLAPQKSDKDWGNKYSDQYAASLNVTFDMVENLGVAFGVAKNFTVGKKLADTDLPTDVALFGKVDYKYGLNDKFYVKPGVGAVWKQFDNETAGAKVAAGVLLGWGAENQDTNIKYMNKKVSDGFSVGTEFAVGKTKEWEDKDNYTKGTAITGWTVENADGSTTDYLPNVIIGVWDSATLVPNLTFGAEVKINNVFSKAWNVKGKVVGEDIDSAKVKEVGLKGEDNTAYVSSLIAEAKYAIDLDGKKITPKVAAKFGAAEVTDEDAAKKLDETGDKTWKLYANGFYCGVDFEGFVPYTTFSVDYETENATVDYMYKGHLDFTCKISL